jgi:type II secretory pathway pseudopilin PulG
MNRVGFSLIEVILATAILLGSVIVLSELAGIGRRQSNRAEIATIAQQNCETLLNEILLGLRPLEAIENEPLLPVEDPFAVELDFEDGDAETDANPFAPKPTLSEAVETDGVESEWMYSIDITPLDRFDGLATLTVTVRQADEQLPRPARFQLMRWIKDPFAVDVDEFAEPGSPVPGGLGL